MNNNKITVAIVTRNRAGLLAECLESLLSQTYKDFELLIVDNYSTDGTRSLVKNFKGLSIRYIHERKIGIPYARNRALDACESEIIAFMDDDCEADRNWVKNIVDAHRVNSRAVAIQGKAISLPRGSIFSEIIQRKFDYWIKINSVKGRLWVLDTKNVSFKATQLKENNLRFDESFLRGSDGDMGKQIFSRGLASVFAPRVVNYHKERRSIFEFIKQSELTGRSEFRYFVKWPRPKDLKRTVKKGINQIIKEEIFKNDFFVKRLLVRIIVDLHKDAFDRGIEKEKQEYQIGTGKIEREISKKVTVAIMTRNRSRLLRRALLSIISQSLWPKEVLIVDNDSRDNTFKVVKEFKKILPIKYIKESRVGIPYVRNLALSHAKGEILAFLDDDCEASSDWVKETEEMHKKHPKAAAIQGESIPIDFSSVIGAVTHRFLQNWIYSSLDRSGNITILDTMNASIKVDLVRKLGLQFDTDFAKYFRGEDTDFALQLLDKHQNIKYSRKARIFYHARDNLKSFLRQRFNSGKLRALIRYKWWFLAAEHKTKSNSVGADQQYLPVWYLKPLVNFLFKFVLKIYIMGLLKESYKLSTDKVKQNVKLVKQAKLANYSLCVVITRVDNSHSLERALQDLASQTIKIKKVFVLSGNIPISEKFTFDIIFLKDISSVLNQISEKDIVVFIDSKSFFSVKWCEEVITRHCLLPDSYAIQGKVNFDSTDLFNLYQQVLFDQAYTLRSFVGVSFFGFKATNLSIKGSVLLNAISIAKSLDKQQDIKFYPEEIMETLVKQRYLISFVSSGEVKQISDEKGLINLINEFGDRGRFQRRADAFHNVLKNDLINERRFPILDFLSDWRLVLHPIVRKGPFNFLLLLCLHNLFKFCFILGYKTTSISRESVELVQHDINKRVDKWVAKYLTVAIITRNRAERLSRLMHSLQGQSIYPFKFLIIDNGSTDATKDIVRRFSKSLSIEYEYEPVVGIPRARNRAIRRANTRYLAFIDDDCVASPTWLKSVIEAHAYYPEAAAVQGNSFSMPKKGDISLISQYIRHNWFIGNLVGPKEGYWRNLKRLVSGMRLSALDTKNVSFNLEILKRNNVSFDENYERGSDTDIGKRLVLNNQKIIFSPSMVVDHYEREGYWEFFVQAFGRGKASEVIDRNWIGEYPTRADFFAMVKPFVMYCFSGNQILKMHSHLMLFMVYTLIFRIGKMYKKLQINRLLPGVRSIQSK